MRQYTRSVPRYAVLLLACLTVSGCSLLDQLRAPPPSEPVAEPQLPPAPVEEPAVAEEPPAPEPTPAPEPAPEPVVEREPIRVSVVLSSRLPDYERVAIALREELGELDVFDLSDKSQTRREVFDAIRSRNTDVVVAVGYRAAAMAATIDDLPVVFSQVFNTGSLELSSERVRGVSVLPPLEKQLAVWRELNPNLNSIGTIIGSGHDQLLEEGARAAEAQGMRFQYYLAHSDRETLYQFTRMVPDIDGFWLFPDNRVLSVSVLREMLTYANRHRVQVAVFNDSLLSIGASLSTTSVDHDIARTIIDVAERLAAEKAQGLPVISPLSEVAVTTSGSMVAGSGSVDEGGP